MPKSRKRRSQPQTPAQDQPAETAKHPGIFKDDSGAPPAPSAKQSLAERVAALLADRDFWIAAFLFSGILVSTFWLASVVRIFCFSSVDNFWLIQTGVDVVSQKRLPTGDIYSFTHYGRRWLLYQWLFEIFVGVIARAGGLQALQAFVEVVCAFIFIVLCLQGLLRRGVNFWIAWWVMTAAGAALISFFTLRPHLVSIVLIYVVQRLLDSHWRKPGWRLLWLGLVFVVWANCHLMFSIGLLMVFLYWMASGIVWWTRRREASEPERTVNWQRFRLLGVAFVLSLSASLVNPYGWETFSYGMLTAGEDYWSSHIGEVMAPDFRDPVGALILAYALLTIVSFMFSTTRPALGEGMVFVVLFAAGVSSYKLVPYFVTVTMHGTGLRLQKSLSELMASRIPARVKAVSGYLTRWARSPGYAVTVIFMALCFGLSRQVLFPPWVPVSAANYLEAHPADGRMFCSAKYGSYLIWRFHGKLPVFIDTRFDMYGPEFSSLYFKANREGARWRELFDHYSVKYALVEARSGIARALKADPGWEQLYLDENSEIFAKVQ